MDNKAQKVDHSEAEEEGYYKFHSKEGCSYQPSAEEKTRSIRKQKELVMTGVVLETIPQNA